MNIDLLVKSFIAFCIGVIVYKVISDRCSCNVVEGQFTSWMESAVDVGRRAVDTGVRMEQQVEQSLSTPQTQNASGAASAAGAANPNTTTNNTSDVPIDKIQTFIKTINVNMFSKSIKDTIKSVIKAIPTDTFSENDIPDYIDTVSSFEQFGVNSRALDYLELIVIEISNLETNEFKLFINNLFSTADYCTIDGDLNAYIISMLLLEYYSIKVDSDLTQEYINISNRLSKYIPKIVDKVQKLNKDCEETNKQTKSTIMDVMVHRLFKDNRTIIKFETIDSILQSIKSLGPIYGVVLMMCITYIIVKMIGIFNTTV